MVEYTVARILGRDGEDSLFADDLRRFDRQMTDAVRGKRFLVYGGAGSIGSEVVKQIFRRKPALLHVVDISENNLVELVRDVRSSLGYLEGESRFLPLDMGSPELSAFLTTQPPYDFVLNLAAMKHVRSEKDEFSLMRMIKTNVLDTLATVQAAARDGTAKYFAVSTDKAKNPANLMGATKRIMEDVLFSMDGKTGISTARFANVAFSDGSLLHGFRRRVLHRQPLSAPRDVRRYFVTGEESGLLCLFAITLGEHRQIFFPKLDADVDLLTFSEIAVRLLEANGYEAIEMSSEDEARNSAEELIDQGKWPCYFFDSDTSGEKPFEEFYSSDDDIDWDRFETLGVIQVEEPSQSVKNRATDFVQSVQDMRDSGVWSKQGLVRLISKACPELRHVDTGKTLDNKM